MALALDLVAIALSIFGILLWLPSYSPNIHIDHRGATDAKAPFNVLFSITNDGYFSVFYVDVLCRLNQLTTLKGSGVTNITIWAANSRMEVHEMQRSDTFDALCPFDKQFTLTSGDAIESANIDILVTFFPRLAIRQRMKCANFVAMADTFGNLNWAQAPVPANNCTQPTSQVWFMKPSQ